VAHGPEVRLRRAKAPAIPPDLAEYAVEIAATLRAAIALHRALPAEREALLAQARGCALAGRGLIIFGQSLSELPRELQLFVTLRALTRLSCCGARREHATVVAYRRRSWSARSSSSSTARSC
jgi:hypothetical protein